MSESDARFLVDGFARLVNSTFDPVFTASILADDFTDYSDSINFLIYGASQPEKFGTPTFTSLAAFSAGQGSQPPVPLTVLSLDLYTCSSIAWRWRAFPGDLPVQGIDIFYTVKTDQTDNGANGWKIQTVYAEFNVANWALDIGGTCVPPPPPPGTLGKRSFKIV